MPKKAPKSLPAAVREELRKSEQKYAELLRHVPVGVYRTTPDGRIVSANPALVRMLGYASEAELKRVNVKDLYVQVRDRHQHVRRLKRRPTAHADLELRLKDGRTIWGRDYPRAIVRSGGRIAFFDGMLADISREKKAEENLKKTLLKLKKSRALREEMIRKLEEISLTDDLTGLFNRRGFFTLGEHAIALSARRKAPMFLLYLDMDGLKRINDTFGHHVGDQALRTMAEILKSTFRTSDLKGRMGGDEFAIFPIDAAISGMEAALARLQQNLDAFNAAPEAPFRLSVSAGIAAFDPEHPSTIEDLIVRADKLMYEAKRRKNESR